MTVMWQSDRKRIISSICINLGLFVYDKHKTLEVIRFERTDGACRLFGFIVGPIQPNIKCIDIAHSTFSNFKSDC